MAPRWHRLPTAHSRIVIPSPWDEVTFIPPSPASVLSLHTIQVKQLSIPLPLKFQTPLSNNPQTIKMQFTTYTAAAIIAFAGAAQAQGAFQSAFDKLTSEYIPSSVFQDLETPIMSAASAAKVTGDFSSIVGSALQASSVPDWFQKAWPTQYSTQLDAITGAVAEIKTAATSAEDAAESKTSEAQSVATTVENGVTSVVTAARSEITEAASSASSGAANKASEVKSKATEVASDIKGGASSIKSELGEKATGSENAGPRQTAAYAGAALGAMGLAMAL